MPRRKRSQKRVDGEQSAAVPKAKSANLFAEENRGLLLDIFVFVANVLVMRLVTRVFLDFFREVSIENPISKLLLGLTFLAMWILPAAGAVLKRWHFHQR